MFLVPGHPGYQHYIDTLKGVALVLSAGVCALSLIELRRDPRDRGRRAIAAALMFITVASTLSTSALDHALVERFGQPNVLQLITSYCSGIGYTTALIIALSSWQDPPEKHRRTTRLWLAMAGGMLVAMLGLWYASLLSDTSIRVFVHFDDGNRLERSTSLPDLVLVWATFKIRSLSGRYARAPRRDWLTRGLSLIRHGTSVQLFFFAGFAVVAVLHGVFGLTVEHPETVGMPCILLAASLILVGIALPSAGPAIAGIWERRSARRAHRELEPLWAELARDNPDIELSRTTSAGAEYLLYRRVVEIRDGLTRLAPHITPPRRDDDSRPGAQAASQIRQALADKQADDGADRPDGFARLAGDDPAADLETEIHWLRQTAKHYARAQQAPEPAARG